MKSTLCVVTFVIICAHAVPVTNKGSYHDKHDASAVHQNSESISKQRKENYEDTSKKQGKRQLPEFGYENHFGQFNGNQNNYQRFLPQDAILHLNEPKLSESPSYSNRYNEVHSNREAPPQQFPPFSANFYEQNNVRQNHFQKQYQNSLIPNTGYEKFSLPGPANILKNHGNIIPFNFNPTKNIGPQNLDIFVDKRPSQNNNIFFNPTAETPNSFQVNNNLGRQPFTNLAIPSPTHHPGNAASFSYISHHDQPLYQNFQSAEHIRFANRYNHIENTRNVSPDNVYLIRGSSHGTTNPSKLPTNGNSPILVVIPHQAVRGSNSQQQRHPSSNQQPRFVGYTAEYSEQVRPFESKPVVNTDQYRPNDNNPAHQTSALAVQLVTVDNKESPYQPSSSGRPVFNIPQNVVLVSKNVHKAREISLPTNPLVTGNIVPGTHSNVAHSSSNLPAGFIASANGWQGFIPDNIHRPQSVPSFPFAPNGYDFVSNGNVVPAHPRINLPPVLIVTSQSGSPRDPNDSNQVHQVQPSVLVQTNHNNINRFKGKNNVRGIINSVPIIGSYTGTGNHVTNVGNFQGVIPGNFIFGDQRVPNNNANSFDNVFIAPALNSNIGGNDLLVNNPISFPTIYSNGPGRLPALNQEQFISDKINQQPVNTFNPNSLQHQQHRGIPNNFNNLVLLYSSLPLDVYQVGHDKQNFQNSSQLEITDNAKFNISRGSSSRGSNFPVEKRFSDDVSDVTNQNTLNPEIGNASKEENLARSSFIQLGKESRNSYGEQSLQNKQMLLGESAQASSSNIGIHSMKFTPRNIIGNAQHKPMTLVKKSILCSKANGKTKRSPNCSMFGSILNPERRSHKENAKFNVTYGEKLPSRVRLLK
ncbi:uncharacterized protein LOC134534669 [Bacillus rossius redtenbacheri]|uniref:uncharacterized protein LOC134534669 n=1 Tax=Bacillus rossius redtenbacheri TaxID=93214 RepID=UPI002FDE3B21